uniref:RBR-type E3 ubiquitin transferase n=1 Tax=Helianthus annuus TaxID=4232 RepID=A0A251SRN9_HELAN
MSHSPTAGKMNDGIEELTTIATEQRCKLMAAGAMESDLELAYRLQLEEAMAASLAVQPSSLQSPQPTPTIIIDDDVSHQTLNLDKTETEVKDHIIIETETNNLHVDLNRPYGEGSSSSSKSEDNAEVFRVYFKGLLSDENVHGSSSLNKAVTMAGIGVAICDSKDEMIFEMKKPLDLIKGDRVSTQSVEGHALIEALKAATALELNRIVFYCDYYPLYQFVSGRWQPKQKKIKNFLDQVNLLRKSFTYCEHSLIARKDVKFAFKLAREAINSQISKVESTQEKLENCVICLDDKSIDQFFSIEGCTHRYCYSCVKQHVEVKLLNGVLPKCPHEGCGNELRIESCEKFLNPKFTEMMRRRLKEDSIPVTEKVYCPYPKCSTLMSTTEALGSIDEIGAITCYKCHGNFCIDCRVPWHTNMNCEEYKRRNPAPIVEESKLKNLAARNLWRQCIKCKHMIELAAGCYHMTCRCGYEFCYTCGAEWKNKKATCTCPIWDEENIVDAEEEDDEDDGFIGFEDDGFIGFEDDGFLGFEGDVPEDDYYNDFEDDGFEHDVPEDVYGDFQHDDVPDDVYGDFEHDDVPEDVYGDFQHDDVGYSFEHDVVVEDDVMHEDDVLECDVVPEYDYFEHDAVLEDDVLEHGDDVLEHGVVPGDDDFEQGVVPDDVYGDFEYDVPEDVTMMFQTMCMVFLSTMLFQRTCMVIFSTMMFQTMCIMILSTMFQRMCVEILSTMLLRTSMMTFGKLKGGFLRWFVYNYVKLRTRQFDWK